MQQQRVPVVAYGLPAFGVMGATVLFTAYIVKYSTDVLLVPAGVMGVLFAVGRLWDGVTDPLVGFLSDRTETRWGRRRPWMVASVVPLALFGWMAWAPPLALEGNGLVVWMAVAVLGFSTATTLFFVPHNALGAELVEDYTRRTSVFAAREYFTVSASLLSLGGGVLWLTTSEDPRHAALMLTLGTSGIIALSMLASMPRLPERREFLGRGSAHPLDALRDTFANPHARTVFAMVLILHMGGGASAVLSPFVMDDVIGAREHTGTVYIVHMVVQLLTIPVWTGLARRVGKKTTWIAAMCCGMVGYAMILFVGEGDLVWMCIASGFTASLHAAGVVIGYSVVADVIDYDELQTGERKEGSYYAVYHFLYKSASGLMAAVAGLAIQQAGYDGSAEVVEQSALVKRTITGLLGGIPLGCIAIGLILFTRYKLTGEEHARIRAALDERNIEAQRD